MSDRQEFSLKSVQCVYKLTMIVHLVLIMDYIVLFPILHKSKPNVDILETCPSLIIGNAPFCSSVNPFLL